VAGVGVEPTVCAEAPAARYGGHLRSDGEGECFALTGIRSRPCWGALRKDRSCREIILGDASDTAYRVAPMPPSAQEGIAGGSVWMQRFALVAASTLLIIHRA
jgi:hypothetical protein